MTKKNLMIFDVPLKSQERQARSINFYIKAWQLLRQIESKQAEKKWRGGICGALSFDTFEI